MRVAVDREHAFLEGIRRVADDVAAPHADAVDRAARFPIEAVDALREIGALSAAVPAELGGDGVSLSAVATGCLELGRRCGAAAMVFAMHQIQVLCIARHLDASPWFAEFLREVDEAQLLIGSATSEVGTGGDMGRSVAAVTDAADGLLGFEKQAPTVSYGGYADALLTTVRRSPDAEPTDQVLVLSRAEQTALEQTGTWDPLGMRGTCSPGFVVRARFGPEQVMATPFARVAAESMVPVSHILWSHLWLGIATDAFDRARAFVRESARRTPGQTPPAAQKLSPLLADLSLLRGLASDALCEFDAASASDDRERLSTVAAALRFNALKLAASERSPAICQGALGVCGIVGYKNDTPFSVGRHLRDALSGALMVANDRIHRTNADLLLIAKDV